ncbi:hypothetical protein HPB48_002368 [Haemaphysalis longicornis]|uniref:Uncharacterized protein n=1 Tax=Haemaphysalis longicornis TaxID=44386 RepID=A0A9J6GHD2_HAELO|nr:hypothetical protein HPB48_002368 [Haemaphysalis longicornis]
MYAYSLSLSALHKLFTECSCVDAPTMYMPSKTGTGFYYMAKRDLCAADCGLVAVYAAAMFVALFFTFLLIVPALTALLRSLDEDIKSTGIGLNYVAIRIFGMRMRCVYVAANLPLLSPVYLSTALPCLRANENTGLTKTVC